MAPTRTRYPLQLMRRRESPLKVASVIVSLQQFGRDLNNSFRQLIYFFYPALDECEK